MVVWITAFGIGVFAWVVVSALLTRVFPALIHPRNRRWDLVPKSKRPFRIAHRGGASEAPENTIAAFEHARQCGADTLELDVHVTADDQLVVVHDNDLSRILGDHINVSETQFKDLPKLPKRCPPSIFDLSRTWVEWHKEEPIPLLEEVFQKFPEMWINLDVKLGSNKDWPKVTKLAADLIRKYKRENLTLWGSGPHYEEQLRSLLPNVILFASARTTITVIVSYMLGILPFIPLKVDAIEPPVCDDDVAKTMYGRYEASTVGKLAFTAFRLILQQTGLYKHLQSRGVLVFSWSSNTEQGVKHAMGLGVDGVMTDFPKKLFPYYKRK
eukprot:TRINITY_DN7788_c0_g1_i2.p1 TRINITY_DN7788_c0_g1~~TRINITY_DN7788_c0_g1_i2.p1  ORF type:complete len:327 (-),score=67.95 TRINITY_DN7788_c0_g1_i2:31-1011(-)